MDVLNSNLDKRVSLFDTLHFLYGNYLYYTLNVNCFVQCSTTCGEGRTYRKVGCYLMNEDKMVDDELCNCPGNCYRKPPTEGRCRAKSPCE